MKKRNLDLIWFLMYFILGAYFLNSGLLYYNVPEAIASLDKFIRIAGGVLIILGGINHLRASSKHRKKKE
jgi:hypothetical protein